jgi:hypothetical protein
MPHQIDFGGAFFLEKYSNCMPLGAINELKERISKLQSDFRIEIFQYQAYMFGGRGMEPA